MELLLGSVGGSRGNRLADIRDAEGLLAVLAFDLFAPNFIWNGQNLSAAEVRADHLNWHSYISYR
jgi:hypothetical protein